jgi:hypothetical protein
MERWLAIASRRAFLAAVAVLVPSLPPGGAGAADPADKIARGPAVGERIPHALTAVDQSGAARDFNAVKSGRGLILLFNRSVDW